MIVNIFWGYHVLILILIIGIKCTISSGFFQIRHFTKWIKSPFQKSDSDKGISAFGALSTALAGTIGTGNIVGVSLAVAVGGAGAIFWMWISAFFGMMTVYAEVSLACKYKSSEKGAISYLKLIGKGKVLPFIYALGCFLSSLAMGNMAQANSVCVASERLGIPNYLIGVILACLVFFFAKGGIKVIANFTQKLVPFMTVLFFVFSLYALFLRKEKIPQALEEIFTSAFSLKGGLGGTMFIAVKTGISRGVFTNEAGLGLSTICFSNVDNLSPKKIGYLGIFQVFMDTIVMCSITGLCILVCTEQRQGDYLVKVAFENVMGNVGSIGMSLCMALFGFATICATSYYGKVGLSYISKGKLNKIFPLFFAVASFLGCVLPLAKVFEICDVFNALLAIPNLIALIFLFEKIDFE